MIPLRLLAIIPACLALSGCATFARLTPGADQQAYGVVSSATPEATAAGVEILEKGGNAVDAAIAVQFALAVTEPAMSGLGGGVQIVLHRPDGGPLLINGTSFAPQGVPEDAVSEQLRRGWTASTVPSTVRAMDFIFERYGSGRVSWGDLLAPAIRYAEEGYAVGEFRARVYERHEADLRASETAGPLFLMPNGQLPQQWDVVRQPVLARTLRRLADAGADDFYNGEIAAQIAEDMALNGGWITAADLAATPEPRVLEPLHARYRGRDVYTTAPPAGGWVVLQALNLLEMQAPEILDANDAERAEAVLSALQLAHRSRAVNPVVDLVDYHDDIAERISEDTARALVEDADGPSGETTHFSVVDANHMAISVTSSIDSYFGARVASPELGFLYNNYMQAFRLDPDHPYRLAPGGMPYSSMSATIVADDGRPVLVLGSPGSARIISAVIQVVSHWIDVGAGIDAAVAAPRFHVVPDVGDGRDNAYLEALPAGLDIEALGFDAAEPRNDLAIEELNAYFGGVHAIALEPGGWRGSADPRRDGAVGYADVAPD